MRVVALLIFCVAAASAASYRAPNKIIGGSATTIDNYPEIALLLFSWLANDVFSQFCGGSVLNQRTILTAAHCFDDVAILSRWRVRVGSSFASSGGVVHSLSKIIIHPNYNGVTDSDIALIHSSSTIVYVANAVQPGSIAGPNYIVADNQVVWAAGWGATELGTAPEQLRHVQIWTINQEVCRERYGTAAITDNMLCSGWLDVGGRDQCSGDSGSPLYHNRVIIGVCSWGIGCADAYYPGVNTRVSMFTAWIQANA